MEETYAVRELFKKLFLPQPQAQLPDYRSYIQSALNSGIRPIDLLMGLLQPALCKLGKLWEEGRITHIQEHEFSTWCKSVLSCFPAAGENDPASDLILVPCPGNRHTLGIHFLNLQLLDQGGLAAL